MNKVFVKRLLSLVMVILMVFPAIGLASPDAPGGAIKAVYFQDENGNMVFVDYSEAIRQSLKGDHILYNAIREYVGVAEEKGKPIYLELPNGKILDYKLAMLDNLFKLQDIMGKKKYEANKKIKCTHELKVIDGKAVIVEIKEEVDSIYTIRINGSETLKLGETGNYDIRAYGDGKGNINYIARYEYTITGGTGTLEYLDGNDWIEIPLEGYFGSRDGLTLTPDWDVTTEIRFTPAEEGTYSIELSLNDLDKNKVLADAEYTLVVTKLEEPLELVSITQVNGIEVETGTTEEATKGLLPKTTTIKDSKNGTHTVNLDWTIDNYDGNVEGEYEAVGIFELPEGVQNSAGLELMVEAIVKVYAPVVEPDFPVEVEDVFVGKSSITNNTYANIKIKEQYVSVVDAVYVDDKLANNMEDEPSQWRILVKDGTTVNDLKGKISVRVRTIMITEIESVGNVSVKFGTPKNEAMALLSQTTTIKDNRGRTHNVDLNWTIENYNGSKAENYNAVATFTLPNGVNENPNIKLEVKATVTVMEEVILTKFTQDALLGKGFGLGSFIVYPAIAEDYENATQYAIVYTVGSSDITVTTDKADLGRAPKDLVQYVEGKNVIGVILFDAEGNEITTIENVMNK